MLIAAVVLALAGEAAACTCAAAPARARLDSADAAFIGRFVDTLMHGSGPTEPDREIGYVFIVDQVVKGELGRRVVVLSPASGAACGFELERNEAHGILLRRDGDAWLGGLCGQIAVGELITAAEATEEPLVNWGGILVGAAVLALGGIFLARRLRRRQGS